MYSEKMIKTMANELVNLETIMERFNLNPDVVAETLFPHNKCAKQALYRIQRGDAELNTRQIAELAKLCGVFVTDLYSVNNPDWTSLDEADVKGGYENGCVTLKFGEYKALINYNGTFITLFHNNMVVDSVVSNAVQAYTLPDLITLIKSMVNKLEK